MAPAHEERTAVSGGFAGLALAIAFAFVFLSRGVADTWMVFLLPLEQDLGATRQEMTGVYSTFMVVTGLSAPVVGVVMQRFGNRVTYSGGVFLIALAFLLASQAHRIWHFYLLIGGLSSMGIAAIGIVPASALISRWFQHRLSSAMAAAYAGQGCGTLAMVPFTQWLIEQVGWRSSYALIGSAVGLLAGATLFLPWRRLAGQPAPVAGKSAAAGGAGLTLRQALLRHEFWSLVTVFAFTGFSMYLVVVQIVAFLVETGYPPLQAATAYGVTGILNVGGILMIGWLADRFGLRPIALLSFTSTFCGMLFLLAMSYAPSLWLLVGYVICFGLAQGARGPIVATLSNRFFAGPAAASIYGVIFACSLFGAGIGSWLAGALHDLTGSARLGIVIGAGGVLIASSPFLFVRAVRHPAPVQPRP